MILLSHTNVFTVIEKGLAYLSQFQQVTGEFPTYFSPEIEMTEATPYPKSVYVTTYVMHALAGLPSSPTIIEMQERAATFLRQEKEKNGAWNYEGCGEWRVPTDLDDTSCAVAALAQLGQHPELSFFSLLWQNESGPGGPYYTWIGINEREDDQRARQIDALVNANILFCSGLLNISLPRTVYYLEQVIRADAFAVESAYTISPHFLIYAISRAYADGNVVALGSVMPTLQDYILSKLPPPQEKMPPFNLACLAISLLNLSTPLTLIRPYLSPLLSSQQPDGSWPAWGAIRGFHPNHDGSPALTTALALESLGKYIRR